MRPRGILHAFLDFALISVGLALPDNNSGPTESHTIDRRWKGITPGEASWALCLHIRRLNQTPVPDINDSRAFDKAVQQCSAQYGDEWMGWNRVYVEHQTWHNVFPTDDLIDEIMKM
ncbi:hypothetical protein F4776DRAFT_615145 [Hypoxylon sp. NC0597]|nr:hypothetical protein F4776DRAFT_615145 [Hypoxylon sp. NC0597]